MKRYYIRIPGFPFPLLNENLIFKRNLHELLINYIGLRDSYINYHKFRRPNYERSNFKAIYYAKLYILSAYEFCEQLAIQNAADSEKLLAIYDSETLKDALKRARHSIAHNKERIQELEYLNPVNRVKQPAMNNTMVWEKREEGEVTVWTFPNGSTIDWFNLEAGNIEGDFWHDCLIDDYFFLMDKNGRIEIDFGNTSSDFVSKSQKILQIIIDRQKYTSVNLERL